MARAGITAHINIESKRKLSPPPLERSIAVSGHEACACTHPCVHTMGMECLERGAQRSQRRVNGTVGLGGGGASLDDRYVFFVSGKRG